MTYKEALADFKESAEVLKEVEAYEEYDPVNIEVMEQCKIAIESIEK